MSSADERHKASSEDARPEEEQPEAEVVIEA